MKTHFALASLLFLLLASPSPSFALMMIDDVSKERAKEMGVTFRSHPNGEAGVAVWIEFKAERVLKNFTRVELRMTSGGKHLVSAPLHATRKSGDLVEAHFSVDPAQLAGCTLRIAVTDSARSHIGYEFRVKDFVEPAKGR
ncbi:MAG: hypothetical protein B9S33_12980 [Pedosphaera sp. Tous-C6FEB]|nr:MAG: hypothetical protein B9S33_12980 [Pedosphaera sp. Tous-C6FEB]